MLARSKGTAIRERALLGMVNLEQRGLSARSTIADWRERQWPALANTASTSASVVSARSNQKVHRARALPSTDSSLVKTCSKSSGVAIPDHELREELDSLASVVKREPFAFSHAREEEDGHIERTFQGNGRLKGEGLGSMAIRDFSIYFRYIPFFGGR